MGKQYAHAGYILLSRCLYQPSSLATCRGCNALHLGLEGLCCDSHHNSGRLSSFQGLRMAHREGLLSKAIKHQGDQREEDDAEVLVPCTGMGRSGDDAAGPALA